MLSATGDWLPVKRGDFEILCREEGELRAVKVTTMTFLRWGKISYLIAEGTVVKKGDKLVALETKEAEEEVQNHTEDLASAERDLAQCEQNRDLDRKRLAIELACEKERAELAVLRETDLLAHPRPIDKQAAENALSGAKARLANAQAVLEAYKPLADVGFASGSEMAQRKLAVAQAQVELERAQVRYGLTMAGPLPEERARAKLQREQAELNVKIKEIDSVEQNADLDSKVRVAARLVAHHQRRLRAHKEELDRSILCAPHDGIAVYRVIEWRGNKKVEVGEMAGPWLSPMELPNFDRMKVRTQVPESFIRKLAARVAAGSTSGKAERVGSPARVVVKTLPDRVYQAEVTWIDGWARDRNSKLSDADIKAQGLSGVRVFDVEVELLESDPQNLREGFRATVEFPVETHPGLLSVPIGAVTSRDGIPHVQVMHDGAAQWRRVELGLQSLDRVVVSAGLAEGEVVFVPRAAPPPRTAEKPPEDTKDGAPGSRNATKGGRRVPEGGPSEGPPPFPARASRPSASGSSESSRGQRGGTTGGGRGPR